MEKYDQITVKYDDAYERKNVIGSFQSSHLGIFWLGMKRQQTLRSKEFVWLRIIES